MSALPLNLVDTAGFLVADNRGRVVGKVECPMYGALPDVPDALSVRGGLFSRRRRLVPADTIADVDPATQVVGLRGSPRDHPPLSLGPDLRARTPPRAKA